jgi:hypothetical protein
VLHDPVTAHGSEILRRRSTCGCGHQRTEADARDAEAEPEHTPQTHVVIFINVTG